jgi:hypothetical protein
MSKPAMIVVGIPIIVMLTVFTLFVFGQTPLAVTMWVSFGAAIYALTAQIFFFLVVDIIPLMHSKTKEAA